CSAVLPILPRPSARSVPRWRSLWPIWLRTCVTRSLATLRVLLLPADAKPRLLLFLDDRSRLGLRCGLGLGCNCLGGRRLRPGLGLGLGLGRRLGRHRLLDLLGDGLSGVLHLLDHPRGCALLGLRGVE